MRRWLAFCSSTEEGTPLALFRIGMGISLLLTVCWVWFGGVVDPVWLDKANGGIHRLRATPLVELLGGPTPTVIYGLLYANVCAGVLLVLGLGGRFTAFVALQLGLGLLKMNGYADAAYDLLLFNGLWLCVLGDSSRTLSLDAKLRTGAWVDPTPIGRWARYLVVLQLAVMYVSTGLQKLSVHWVPWGDLQALYYIWQMPTFHYTDMSWTAPAEPLLQLATLVTWVWEVTAFLFLLAALGVERGSARWKWVRAVYIALGVTMHVILLFTMELGPFGFTSLAFYVALFTPDEWRALWKRLAGQREDTVVTA